jgi:hypothetical protein
MMTETTENTHENTSEIEEITPRVTREWLDNRQLVVYTIQSLTREATDAWVEAALELFRQWPANKPILIVYDFAQSGGVALTPYIRKRAEELSVIRPDVRGRVAVILPRSVGTQAARIFILAKLKKSRLRRIFFTREEGLAWVRQSDD